MKTLNIKRLTSDVGFILLTGLMILCTAFIVYLAIENRSYVYPLMLVIFFNYSMYARMYILTRRQNPQIILGENSITIYGSEVKLEDIHRIVMRGYLSTSYSIQLKNKKIVSPLHQFKFGSNNIKNEDAFTKWAKEKNILLEHGYIWGAY